MFDRYIRTVAERTSYDAILAEVRPLLGSVDLTIANLEGPLTTHPSRSVRTVYGDAGHMTFTMSPNVAPLLKRHNIGLVSLGNNHSRDLGLDGVHQTKAFLTEHGVQYVGDPLAPNDPVIIELGGRTLGFIAYNQFGGQRVEEMLASIADVRDAVEYVFVLPHWGEEYVPVPGPSIVRLARQMIDAGADAVIGTHPHVIQTVEQYRSGVIHYSLGNFVFDQYFSPETMRGRALEVVITPDGELVFIEHSVRMQRDGTTVMEPVE
jgi:gamma-polyglutamate biosynthesis protein CapA